MQNRGEKDGRGGTKGRGARTERRILIKLIVEIGKATINPVSEVRDSVANSKRLGLLCKCTQLHRFNGVYF